MLALFSCPKEVSITPYLSKEQIAAAREMDPLTYLRRFEPEELVHIGGDTYATRTHDSLKISNGKWCWWSRGIGGTNALDYLTIVEGLSFLDAVQRILGELPHVPPKSEPTAPLPKTEFSLPPKHADNRRVFAYLRSRGIDAEIINHCIKHGQLYEDAERHNCVFVGYPAEVRASEENGVYRLEKVYYLTAKDDPATIPTADFEREGHTYTLLDLLKNDQTETDTREHIEVVTLESKTKDMAEILKMLEPKLEVKTEDGYEGVLSLDHTTIQVEAAGYGTSSRTVTAERTYPNLSDADVSLVPKSVNENGRTLTLADVSWQEAAVDPTDGYDIPIRYTAVASYTGTATSKYATGYTVTADYKGDVTRTSCDTVVYTAVFSSIGNEAATDSSSFNWLWLLIPVGAAALGGCGYAGYKGYRHYINKKRGYAA